MRSTSSESIAAARHAPPARRRARNGRARARVAESAAVSARARARRAFVFSLETRFVDVDHDLRRRAAQVQPLGLARPLDRGERPRMCGSARPGSPISSSVLAAHMALYASSSGLFTATTGLSPPSKSIGSVERFVAESARANISSIVFARCGDSSSRMLFPACIAAQSREHDVADGSAKPFLVGGDPSRFADDRIAPQRWAASSRAPRRE